MPRRPKTGSPPAPDPEESWAPSPELSGELAAIFGTPRPIESTVRRIDAIRYILRPGQKVPVAGTVVSIQPRIRLRRSFDERQHSYLGYNLTVLGFEAPNDNLADTEISIAIGKAAQAKFEFQVGDDLSAEGVLADPDTEAAELYKITKLKKIGDEPLETKRSPPFLGVPPALEVYRERGCRRLDADRYNEDCSACIWGAKMPVQIVVDGRNPKEDERFWTETFCYGPRSCPVYKAGPARTVPGREGMTHIDGTLVDGEETRHRGERE